MSTPMSTGSGNQPVNKAGLFVWLQSPHPHSCLPKNRMNCPQDSSDVMVLANKASVAA